MVELDSTAGYRLYWKNHDIRNILFLDRRLKVKPDIVGDARCLPFHDAVFDVIHVDPPHIIQPKQPRHREEWREDQSFKGRKFNEEHQVWTMPEILAEKYTFWKSRTEAVSFMFHTNREYCRTLKPNGIMQMKIIDGEAEYNHAINIKMIKELYSNFAISAEVHMRKLNGLLSHAPIYLVMQPAKLGRVSN